mgnify:CR=1 FL=1|tara:strand:- start:344 stop:709 length:366 start_codon:yes stop_codon:yes gene_type:complete
MRMIIQNDIHRFERDGGWSLTRIVRDEGHTIKARVDWGYQGYQKEASAWVWTSVGWQKAVTVCTLAGQSTMKVAAITMYDMDGHKEPRPPGLLYDLFDQDADSLIGMTLAMLEYTPPTILD